LQEGDGVSGGLQVGILAEFPAEGAPEFPCRVRCACDSSGCICFNSAEFIFESRAVGGRARLQEGCVGYFVCMRWRKAASERWKEREHRSASELVRPGVKAGVKE